jgi:hypothetical protein
LDNLELWLGEAKFYTDFSPASKAVIDELKQHVESQYLRNEFLLICNKIDDNDDFSDKLKDFISERNSLDNIIKRICIPIFITYNSEVVQSHTKVDDIYIEEFKSEVEKNYKSFIDKCDIEIKFHLFLFPLHNKDALNTALHEQLSNLQKI